MCPGVEEEDFKRDMDLQGPRMSLLQKATFGGKVIQISLQKWNP